MAQLNIGDSAIIELRLQIPRSGIWMAQLTLDADAPPTGRVTISQQDGQLQWEGTVDPDLTGTVYGATMVRVVGGAGGLNTPLTPRGYTSTDLGLILDDIARDAGEESDDAQDVQVRGTQVAAWVRMAHTGARQLSQVAQIAGGFTIWRLTPGGKIWIGTDTFPEFTEDHEILDPVPVEGMHTIGMDHLALLPGVTIDGDQVSYVEHVVQGTKMRSHYWTEV